MTPIRRLGSTCAALLAAMGFWEADALRTKAAIQPSITAVGDVHRDLHMNVAGLEPFTRLRVTGPMAVNVITRSSASQPYLIRQPGTELSTWTTRTKLSEWEAELALEFPGPNFSPIVATIVVPKPLAAIRVTYQANVTIDYSGADISADTFGQVRVEKAVLMKTAATPVIAVTSQSNITIGELHVQPGASQIQLSACSHGIIRVFNYVAPEADSPIRLEAKNMGIVIVDGLWAPHCRQLSAQAAEQGHIVTRRGVTGGAELYCGTGSVLSLGHSVTADARIFADSGSYASITGPGIRASATCNSGSLVRVVGARALERTATMGCWIFAPGEPEFDPSYCFASGGRWTAACALTPLPPVHPGVLMEGVNAPLGALQWLETMGHHDPDSPEVEQALNLLVFKNAEWYTQVHNVINRYNWYWEQDVLKQQLAVSELVSGAPR